MGTFRKFLSTVTLSVFLVSVFFPSLKPVLAVEGDPIDLRIESATFIDGILDVSIKNIGTEEITQTFFLDFLYMDNTDPDNPTQLGMSGFNIADDLLPGEMYSLPLQAPALPEGTDFIRVFLNPALEEEEDETNNVMDLMIPVPPPSDIDLTLPSANFVFSAGRIDVMFRNDGTDDITVNVNNELNFLAENGELLGSSDFTLFGGIAAGAQLEQPVFLDLPEGTVTIEVVADAPNEISETDETNNTLNVDAAEPLPTNQDLIITSADPNFDFGSMTFTVQNTGTDNITVNFFSQINYYNANAENIGTAGAGGVIAGLMAGEQRDVLAFFDIPEGAFAMEIMTDSSNEVAELDEINNTFTVQIPQPEVNAPPVAVSEEFSVFSGRDLDGQVIGTDAEDALLSFRVVDEPQNGFFVFDEEDGMFSYRSFEDVAEFQDSFTFVVNDGTQDSAPATVTINVQLIPMIDMDENLAEDFELPLNLDFNGIVAAYTETEITFRVDAQSPLIASIQVQKNEEEVTTIEPTSAITFPLDVGGNGFTFTLFSQDNEPLNSLFFFVDRAQAQLSDLRAPGFELAFPFNGMMAILNDIPYETTSVNVIAETDDQGVTSIVVRSSEGSAVAGTPGSPIQVPVPAANNYFNVELRDAQGSYLGRYPLEIHKDVSNAPLVGGIEVMVDSSENNLLTNFDQELFNYNVSAKNGDAFAQFRLSSDNLAVDHYDLIQLATSERTSMALSEFTSAPLEVGDNQFILVPMSADNTQLSEDVYSVSVTRSQPVSVAQDAQFSVVQGGLLAQAVTVDANGSNVVLVSATNMPTQGTLVINPNGTFEYGPNDDFSGVDSFTFVANNGTEDSNEGTVTITVTPSVRMMQLGENLVQDFDPVYDPASFKNFINANNDEDSVTFVPVLPEGLADTVFIQLENSERTRMVEPGTEAAFDLDIGENNFMFTFSLNEIYVGSQRIIVDRAAPRVLNSVSTLASLTENTSGDLSPAFAPNIAAYTLDVNNAVDRFALTFTASDPLARITMGEFVVQPGVALDLNLSVGANPLSFLVTAENGATTTYSVVVNRAAADTGQIITFVAPSVGGGDSGRSINSVNNVIPGVVLGAKVSRLDVLLKKLTVRSKGKQVKELQQVLKAQGYLPKKFSVNGVYGKATQKAVAKYLKDQKKPQKSVKK
ncbi:MAG: cadherin-like beta sandwich domain-containing protein [Patescibacteria group bacterium]